MNFNKDKENPNPATDSQAEPDERTTTPRMPREDFFCADIW